jgi:spore germination protein PB
MNLIIHQTIIIHQLKVDAVSNSSMLQIGSTGTAKMISQLFNTGGYTGPAPEPGKPFNPNKPPTNPVVHVPLSSIT